MNTHIAEQIAKLEQEHIRALIQAAFIEGQIAALKALIQPLITEGDDHS